MEKQTAINDIEETAIAKWRSSRHQQGKRETAQDISNKSVIQLKKSAIEAWYSSSHQQQNRDAAQEISNRSMIQLKSSATKPWCSSRHQQQKHDTAQNISKGLYPSYTQVPLLVIFQPFSLGTRHRFLSKTLSVTLHGHISPFINANCFFRDFPAFFVGGPLSVLVKNPDFSPSCAHFPFHKHQLLFLVIFQPFS